MAETSNYSGDAIIIRNAIDNFERTLDDALQLLAETQPGRRERLRLALLTNPVLMQMAMNKGELGQTCHEVGIRLAANLDKLIDGLLAKWGPEPDAAAMRKSP